LVWQAELETAASAACHSCEAEGPLYKPPPKDPCQSRLCLYTGLDLHCQRSRPRWWRRRMRVLRLHAYQQQQLCEQQCGARQWWSCDVSGSSCPSTRLFCSPIHLFCLSVMPAVLGILVEEKSGKSKFCGKLVRFCVVHCDFLCGKLVRLFKRSC
jgi:hypothetical protein